MEDYIYGANADSLLQVQTESITCHTPQGCQACIAVRGYYCRPEMISSGLSISRLLKENKKLLLSPQWADSRVVDHQHALKKWVAATIWKVAALTATSS